MNALDMPTNALDMPMNALDMLTNALDMPTNALDMPTATFLPDRKWKAVYRQKRMVKYPEPRSKHHAIMVAGKSDL
jgi:hypothetical protein